MEVRQARAADWEAVRDLRLRALADAPEAFAGTLETELALPAEEWRRRAAGGPASARFIAGEGDTEVGLAAIFAEPGTPGRMHLVSMWVDPRHRRRGVARALVDQAVGRAAERQAREVILWVVELIPGLVTLRLYERQLPALWRLGPVTVADHTRDDTVAGIAGRILAGAARHQRPARHARADPAAPREELAAGIPGAQLVVVAGAGHLSPLDQPERVTRRWWRGPRARIDTAGDGRGARLPGRSPWMRC